MSEFSVNQIQLTDSETGVLIPIKVSAGAKTNACRGVVDGHLKIAVTSIAEKGKANSNLLTWLAEKLDVSKSSIRIVAGMRARIKILEVSGIEKEALVQILRRLMRK